MQFLLYGRIREIRKKMGGHTGFIFGRAAILLFIHAVNP